MNRFCRFWISFFLPFLATGIYLAPLSLANQQSLYERDPSAEVLEKSSFSNKFFRKYAAEVDYLDLEFIGHDVTKNLIIDVPPEEGSELEQEDEAARMAISTLTAPDPDERQKLIDQKLAALSTIDNVFAFSSILGDQFNYHELQHTKDFFAKVDSDVGVAVSAAKKTFRRPRPLKSNGFSYPSGHSTRAFVREELLSEIFPKCQEALYCQAQQFAQNRVIIGRHYPRDIAAGEIYGKYLAKQFRKDPQFQKEWNKVKKEIEALFPHPEDFNPLIIPIVTPALATIIPPIDSRNFK